MNGFKIECQYCKENEFFSEKHISITQFDEKLNVVNYFFLCKKCFNENLFSITDDQSYVNRADLCVDYQYNDFCEDNKTPRDQFSFCRNRKRILIVFNFRIFEFCPSCFENASGMEFQELKKYK